MQFRWLSKASSMLLSPTYPLLPAKALPLPVPLHVTHVLPLSRAPPSPHGHGPFLFSWSLWYSRLYSHI